ncbi:thioredoxin family protein [Sulfurimonas sp. SAG-AH-194-I05]|nr:thioredoxin family protein [Sulfurimonas sp. SAG-AH-194-I05]MDF1875859.1 thioredoxin family protein [Sulfurimonas sp. SAG-AH-194-I05]
MKKILIISLLLASSLLANMQWADSYKEALQSAKVQNKIVMVMLSRSTCGVCEYMKAQVFTEKNIIKQFNERFVGVNIDLDFEEAPQSLDYIGTPTFYFLDKDAKKLGRISGGKNAKSFSQALEKIN